MHNSVMHPLYFALHALHPKSSLLQSPLSKEFFKAFFVCLGGYLLNCVLFSAMQIEQNLGSLLSSAYILNEQIRKNLLNESTPKQFFLIRLPHARYWWKWDRLLFLHLVYSVSSVPTKAHVPALGRWCFRHTVQCATENTEKLNSGHLT